MSNFRNVFILSLIAFFFFTCTEKSVSEKSIIQIKGLEEKTSITLLDFLTNDTVFNSNCMDTVLDLDQTLANYKHENLILICFIKNKNFKYQEFFPLKKDKENIISIELANYKNDFSAQLELSGSEELRKIDKFNKSIENIKQSMFKELNQENINFSYLESLNIKSDSIGLDFFFQNSKNILSKLFIYNKLNGNPAYLTNNLKISHFIDSICEYDSYTLNNIDLCSYYGQVSESISSNENEDEKFYLRAKNRSYEFYSLDSIKDKYILIDFWATWCKPCLKEIEISINKLNSKKYKDKLEVVFISIDSDSKRWNNFVPTFFDTTNNIHLIDYNNITKEHFNIEYIPQNILLNKNKKIIGRNIKGDNLFNTLDVWIENK